MKRNHDQTGEAPIYVQLKQEIVALILEGLLAEGRVAPSVRHLAEVFDLNPLTVSKAFQDLVNAGVLEKRRGVGMFVRDGARARLLEQERARFLSQDWPQLARKLDLLGITVEELKARPPSQRSGPAAALAEELKRRGESS